MEDAGGIVAEGAKALFSSGNIAIVALTFCMLFLAGLLVFFVRQHAKENETRVVAWNRLADTMVDIRLALVEQRASFETVRSQIASLETVKQQIDQVRADIGRLLESQWTRRGSS